MSFGLVYREGPLIRSLALGNPTNAALRTRRGKHWVRGLVQHEHFHHNTDLDLRNLALIRMAKRLPCIRLLQRLSPIQDKEKNKPCQETIIT